MVEAMAKPCPRAALLCKQLSHMTQAPHPNYMPEQGDQAGKGSSNLIHIHLFILSKLFIEYLSCARQ